MITISNWALSDTLCDSVNRGLTLVRMSEFHTCISKGIMFFVIASQFERKKERKRGRYRHRVSIKISFILDLKCMCNKLFFCEPFKLLPYHKHRYYDKQN